MGASSRSRSWTCARRPAPAAERGLLSLAFAPDYATSGRFYVDYTDTRGDSAHRRVPARQRGSRRPRRRPARCSSRASPSPTTTAASLLFGPDGELYVGFGDGGGGGDQHGARGNAQNLGTLLGKILRIDPRRHGSRPYTVPTSNPFVGRSRGARARSTLRAAQPLALLVRPRDRRSERSATSARTSVEEIDFVAQGAGQAARTSAGGPFEGTRALHARRVGARGDPAGARATRTGDGWCSITGGVVVRDRGAARPATAATCSATTAGSRARRGACATARRATCAPTALHVAELSSFGEDASGRVYATSLDGPGLPARAALRARRARARRLRHRIRPAPNPAPLTLGGTNTWVLGRDPAWVIDPGPGARRAPRRGGRGGGGARRRRRDRAHPRSRRPRRGDRAAARAAGPRARGGLPPAGGRSLADGDVRPAAGPASARPRGDHLVFVGGAACFTGDAVLGEGSVFVGRARCASTWPGCGACARSTADGPLPGPRRRRCGIPRRKLDELPRPPRWTASGGCWPRSTRGAAQRGRAARRGLGRRARRRCARPRR